MLEQHAARHARLDSLDTGSNVSSRVETRREELSGIRALEYTGWPRKVIHYQESSLNRIKNRQCGATFLKILSIKCAQECYKSVLNILCVT